MKKRVYIDMDGVLANIYDQHIKYNELFPLQPYPQSQYGFFMGMKPIQDSIETVKKLMEIFDVWILTAPSWKNPMCLAEKNYWIREHFGIEFCEKIIICSDKSLCIGDYLIDDNSEGRGQDKFTGELILFGSEKFPDWKTVYSYLNPPKSITNKDAIFVSYSPTGLPVFKLGTHIWIEGINDIIPIK